MKKAPLRDLQTRRAKPVADLRPLSRKARKIQSPDMSRIWNTLPQLAGDSDRFIAEDRDR
jgi:antitoxin (DNA-binding transcriptional repressor) of toxin-antitoxin stability system